MKIKKTSVIFFIFILSIFSFCKKKQEEDKSKYKEVCDKVVQCDQSLQQFGDVLKHCQSLLSSIEKTDVNILNPILECIKTSKCEELSLLKCTEPHIKNLQMKKPGEN